MNWKTLTPRARFRLINLFILLFGFGVACILYLAAPREIADPLGDPLESKKYLHDMEVYGGKVNLLEDEFRRWFDGLWHGKQLATTVAFLTVAVVLLLQLIASQRHVGTAGTVRDGKPLRLVAGNRSSADQPSNSEETKQHGA